MGEGEGHDDDDDDDNGDGDLNFILRLIKNFYKNHVFTRNCNGILDELKLFIASVKLMNCVVVFWQTSST